MRGGVSSSSLPLTSMTTVFPTCGGVFPGRSAMACIRCCLPHVRGGVSGIAQVPFRLVQSSPRAWGCFYSSYHEPFLGGVFPTCVGVFPHCFEAQALTERLPHVRGGVSDELYALLNNRLSSPRAWGCFREA